MGFPSGEWNIPGPLAPADNACPKGKIKDLPFWRIEGLSNNDFSSKQHSKV